MRLEQLIWPNAESEYDNLWITWGLINVKNHLHKRRYEKQWANTPKVKYLKRGYWDGW